MSAKIFRLDAARRQGGMEVLRPGALLPSDQPAVADSFADLPLEFLLDVDPDELQEFLDCDGVTADPVFKETLRRKLWAIVSARLRALR